MELREVNDSLESLHQRMDRFYAWASELQVQYRDLKQRIGFIEATMQESFSFGEQRKAPSLDSFSRPLGI